jgi:TRAP-type C4-dicarboxylate transport system substrate-binding protein
MRFTTLTATGATALMIGLAPAAAQETVNLTVVSGYPPTVSWTREFRDFFIPEMATALEGSGYEVQWNEAYSGQIAGPGGELEAVQTGLADVGIVVIPFHTDIIPLYAINFYTPFVTTDVNLASNTIEDLAEEYPDAFAAQWETLNQIPLSVLGVVDTYNVVVDTPINTLDDFDGLRIGGSGANQLWVEGFGATGVRANLADAYNDIQTGVMDGMVIHAGGALNARLYEVAPYLVDADFGAVASFIVTVNADTWERLPDPVKEALQSTADAYADHAGDVGAQDSVEGLEVIEAEGGTIIEIGADERTRWAENMPNIAQNWAADMEELGYPGIELLSQYMTIMRDAGAPIARQWDQN